MRVYLCGMGTLSCASRARLMARRRLHTLGMQQYYVFPSACFKRASHTFAGIVAYHSPTSPFPFRL